MTSPGRPAFGPYGRSCAAPRGPLFGSRGVSPLLPGPGRDRRVDALASRRAATTVRYVSAHSLRPLSRVRATTFMHVVLPPPDVPAPAGPADKAAASRGRFHKGVMLCLQSRKTPGPSRACGGDPPPDHPGRNVPARRSPKSNTRPGMQQGHAGESSLSRRRRCGWPPCATRPARCARSRCGRPSATTRT